jgi:hypothetical protein
LADCGVKFWKGAGILPFTTAPKKLLGLMKTATFQVTKDPAKCICMKLGTSCSALALSLPLEVVQITYMLRHTILLLAICQIPTTLKTGSIRSYKS